MRKILIIGHARHGKDTVAEMIADYTGEGYKASSEICAAFIFKVLERKHGYNSPKECFEDRINHRAEWHELIKQYCSSDKAALAKLIYKDNLIYCGVRDTLELKAIVKEFNPFIIWVHADKPLEPANSMNIVKHDAWSVIDNTDTLDSTRAQVHTLLWLNGYLEKWQQRFFNLAYEAASWSKDKDCKVGAALVSPSKRSFSLGYNGFPKNIADTKERLEDKELKNQLTVHAEQNVIRNAEQSVVGWQLFVTKPPCIACALEIVQAGITEVYCPMPERESSWYSEQVRAISLLEEAKIRAHVVRDGVLISVGA